MLLAPFPRGPPRSRARRAVLTAGAEFVVQVAHAGRHGVRTCAYGRWVKIEIASRACAALALVVGASALAAQQPAVSAATREPRSATPRSVAHAADPSAVADEEARAGVRTASAWLPYWNAERAYKDALRHASQLHTVSPFWYEAGSATRVKSHEGAGDRRIIDGLHDAGMKVVPTVTETLGPEEMARMLGDRRARRAHVRALERIVGSGAYDGIDLDYERMTYTDDERLRGRVRAGYNALVSEVCARLHAKRKQCVVTVMPRTRWAGQTYDYARLGKAADRVRLMGYNLHWAEGAPGPISSRAWYDEFLRYATATVPRDKIEVALPAYGWNWARGASGGTRARARHVTAVEAQALRKREGAAYRFDAESGTPYFTYDEGRVRREVWYQDARGIAAHLPLLKKYGVRNVGLWALGFEESRFWSVLRRR